MILRDPGKDQFEWGKTIARLKEEKVTAEDRPQIKNAEICQ